MPYRQCITKKSEVPYRQCGTDFNFLKAVRVTALSSPKLRVPYRRYQVRYCSIGSNYKSRVGGLEVGKGMGTEMRKGTMKGRGMGLDVVMKAE